MHESNTFAPGITGTAQFGTSHGAAIIERSRGGNSAIAGFIDVLDKNGCEPVGLFVASATPGGAVAADALQEFWARIETELAQAGHLDAILVAPHGAGVSEELRDMDGWWLGQLRALVGPEMPITGVIDPHCNLTQAMLDATDVLLPFKMNPHLDAKVRGIKAAEILLRMLRENLRPRHFFSAPPLVINIEQQHTEAPPLSPFYARCREFEARDRVLDACLLLGFHFADVPEMNSGALVYTEDDAALAAQLANQLGDELWRARDQFAPALLEADAAIERARGAARPVCLLDMGDNIGGGATGQGTHLLHALAAHSDLQTFFCVHDPAAALRAHEVGIGGAIEAELGGHVLPERDGAPFHLTGTVEALPAPQYHDPVMRHGGSMVFRPGQCALLRSANLAVFVTSNRLSPNSPEMVPHCGLDANTFDVIVAKGVNGPLGAFDEMCPTFIKVSTPGVTSADLSHFEFHRRRVPLFPFETDFEWNGDA